MGETCEMWSLIAWLDAKVSLEDPANPQTFGSWSSAKKTIHEIRGAQNIALQPSKDISSWSRCFAASVLWNLVSRTQYQVRSSLEAKFRWEWLKAFFSFFDNLGERNLPKQDGRTYEECLSHADQDPACPELHCPISLITVLALREASWPWEARVLEVVFIFSNAEDH
jgi:hypothetical protein